MEIVINTCFGGFGLSHEGMVEYAKRKGVALYPEKTQFSSTVYWIVPPEERVQDLPRPWGSNTEEARKEFNRKYSEQTLYDRDIPRDDPVLIGVVKDLGSRSFGELASLEVVEIPDDVNWEIEEYDGNEHIAEIHRTWR